MPDTGLIQRLQKQLLCLTSALNGEGIQFTIVAILHYWLLRKGL